MHPKVALFVKEELMKLLDVGFIKPMDYLDLTSNMVPIALRTGGFLVCIL